MSGRHRSSRRFPRQCQPHVPQHHWLLEAEGATWKDIVRTTCYLRDIERDYAAFNEERTNFFRAQGLDPLPASTGIQAILCRPDLLVEIEAIAMYIKRDAKE
jgi:enamine deaminase RidA (YjgF/YER057c/UK114 family)